MPPVTFAKIFIVHKPFVIAVAVSKPPIDANAILFGSVADPPNTIEAGPGCATVYGPKIPGPPL